MASHLLNANIIHNEDVDSISKQDKNCSLVSYYDISLFWIIFHENIETRNNLNHLYTKKKDKYNELKNPKIGELVFALNEEQCCRAEILDIETIDFDNVYVCFLLDFGLIVRTKQIYSLPWELSDVQSFAKRAMLSTKPLTSTDTVNKFIIKKCGPEANIKFQTHYKYKNYFIGDLIFFKDGRRFSICRELNKTGLTSSELFLKSTQMPNFKIDDEPLSKIYNKIINISDFHVKTVHNLSPHYFHLTIRKYYESEHDEDRLIPVHPLIIEKDDEQQYTIPNNYSSSDILNDICESSDKMTLKNVVNSSTSNKSEDSDNQKSELSFDKKECTLNKDVCESFNCIRVNDNEGNEKQDNSTSEINTEKNKETVLDLVTEMNGIIENYNSLKWSNDEHLITSLYKKIEFIKSAIDPVSFDQLNTYMSSTFYVREITKKEEKTVEKTENVIEKLRRLFYRTPEKEYFKVTTKIFPEYKIGRELEPRLLFHMHFINGGIKPIFELNKHPFNSEIASALHNLEIKTPKGSQCYVWPALFRGYNTCVISGTKNGKTMTYVPIISNYLFDIHPDLPKINAPIAIIICPKVSIVEKVYNQFNSLLKSTCKNKHIQEFSSTLNLTLQNNADIVVTTPKMFVRLCKHKVMSLKRLHFVVFEEADEIFGHFPQEVHYLMENVENVVMKRKEFVSLQFVTVAKHWSEPMEDFLLMLQDAPVICIEDHIEAIVYGRAKIHLHFVKTDDMGFKVTEIVGDKWKYNKTVIICNTITEQLIDYISVQGLTYVTVTEESNTAVINKRWYESKLGSYFVIICTDKIFQEKLTIVDAELIVQYCLPENMADFGFRFSGFVDRFDSVLNTDVEKMRKYNMHIILDETDEKQLKVYRHLYQALTNNEFYINNEPVTKDIIKDFKTKYEQEKLTEQTPLCEHFLLFKTCGDICLYRHTPNHKLDITNTLPRSGMIKLTILNIESPIKLACRIKMFKVDDNDDIFEYKYKYDEILSVLAREKYGVVQMLRKDMKPGLWCAVEPDEREYLYVRGEIQRGKIVEVDDRNGRALVRFIDLGYEKYIHNKYIYYLPDELYENLPQTVVVYLSNIKPPDHDVTWSTSYTNRLNEEVQKLKDKEFIGKVRLQLGDGIFVDDLYLHSETDNEDDFTYTEEISICKFLKTLNIVQNCNQLDHLYKLCTKNGIPLSGNTL